MKNDNSTKMIFKVNCLVTYYNKSPRIMKNVGLRHFLDTLVVLQLILRVD